MSNNNFQYTNKNSAILSNYVNKIIKELQKSSILISQSTILGVLMEDTIQELISRKKIKINHNWPIELFGSPDILAANLTNTLQQSHNKSNKLVKSRIHNKYNKIMNNPNKIYNILNWSYISNLIHLFVITLYTYIVLTLGVYFLNYSINYYSSMTTSFFSYLNFIYFNFFNPIAIFIIMFPLGLLSLFQYYLSKQNGMSLIYNAKDRYNSIIFIINKYKVLFIIITVNIIATSIFVIYHNKYQFIYISAIGVTSILIIWGSFYFIKYILHKSFSNVKMNVNNQQDESMLFIKISNLSLSILTLFSFINLINSIVFTTRLISILKRYSNSDIIRELYFLRNNRENNFSIIVSFIFIAYYILTIITSLLNNTNIPKIKINVYLILQTVFLFMSVTTLLIGDFYVYLHGYASLLYILIIGLLYNLLCFMIYFNFRIKIPFQLN